MATGRPPSNPDRIVSLVYAAHLGYAEYIGNVAYTRVGGRRKSTNLRRPGADWSKRQKEEHTAKIRELLDARILLLLRERNPEEYPVEEQEEEEEQGFITVQALIDEYRLAKWPAREDTDGSVRLFLQACAAYFPDDIATSMPVEHGTLYHHITTRDLLLVRQYATNTHSGYLSQIKALCVFAVKRKYLERSPFEEIDVPPAETRDEDERAMPEADVDKVLEAIEQLAGREIALGFALIRETGLRHAEALKLSWGSNPMAPSTLVRGVTIRIDGKRKNGKAARRSFPLRSFPRAFAVVEELAGYNSEGRVYHWLGDLLDEPDLKKAKDRMRYWWDKAKAAAGVEFGVIHSLRATLSHRLRIEYGLSPDEIGVLISHSRQANERYYRQRATLSEIERIVARHVEPVEGQPEVSQSR